MSNNKIYIGKKPVLNYCQTIIRGLFMDKTVEIQARGSSICRAVDAVEVTRNRYLNGVKIKSIDIGTDKLSSRDGEVRSVSNMTIVLEKHNN